jgi:hypothetical protein
MANNTTIAFDPYVKQTLSITGWESGATKGSNVFPARVHAVVSCSYLLTFSISGRLQERSKYALVGA